MDGASSMLPPLCGCARIQPFRLFLQPTTVLSLGLPFQTSRHTSQAGDSSTEPLSWDLCSACYVLFWVSEDPLSVPAGLPFGEGLSRGPEPVLYQNFFPGCQARSSSLFNPTFHPTVLHGDLSSALWCLRFPTRRYCENCPICRCICGRRWVPCPSAIWIQSLILVYTEVWYDPALVPIPGVPSSVASLFLQPICKVRQWRPATPAHCALEICLVWKMGSTINHS